MSPLDSRRRAFRLCIAIIAVTILGVGAFAARLDWQLERDLWLIRSSGVVAALFLLGSVSMTPLRRLLPIRVATAHAYRRALGMSAAWITLVHLSFALAFVIAPAWEALIHRANYRSGVVAAVVLFALLLTSYPAIVKISRIKLWPELHRLAYAVLILVGHHVLLSSFARRSWVLAGLAIAGLGLLLRFLPARQPLSTGRAQK